MRCRLNFGKCYGHGVWFVLRVHNVQQMERRTVYMFRLAYRAADTLRALLDFFFRTADFN